MVTTDRLQGISGDVAIKPACYVASTANLVLSSTQVVDGISVGSCERVLAKDQTDAKENGIYVADTGSWGRARDFDGSRDAIPGTLVYVDRGTAYGNLMWVFNSSSTAIAIDIGSTGDDITVTELTLALTGVSSFSQNTLLPLTTALAWRSSDGLDIASTLGSDFSQGLLALSSGVNWRSSDGLWLGSASTADTVDEDDMSSDSAILLPSQQSVKAYADAVGLRGYIDGLILSNDADTDHDIAIAAGIARDGGDAVNLTLAAVLTKQIDAAWAVGDDQGGLDGTESVGGTPDASTWYHVWLICRSDTGVVDALFSENATAPTMPTDYDQKRRIGAVLTDGSANIIGFKQDGDRFIWDVMVQDLTTSTPSTAGALETMSVPTGIVVMWEGNAFFANGTTGYVLVTSPDSTNSTPTSSLFDITASGGTLRNSMEMSRKTDTSGQIRYRSDDGTVTEFALFTRGWIDPRGRNA